MKKDYLKLFVDYCRKNRFGFVVWGGNDDYNGLVGEIQRPGIASDLFPDKEYKFGTKAAYDWLIKTQKKVKGE